jgi:uncharacterized protein (TIGR03067 family)
MADKLPARPNLDHLRRQAKALLASLRSGDAEAAATLLSHLPVARGMTLQQVREAAFRLADAQSAIARKTGFASWPALARHVDQLRALEGTWAFSSLEIEGTAMPPAMFESSRLLIDGDRFCTEAPEAVYEGVFNIDVEADPHHIDIEFVTGPEASNINRGIFQLDGDALALCLDMTGKGRPAEFRSTAGTGHAFERLTRSSASRPENVTGGIPVATPSALPCGNRSEFEFVESATLTRLAGEWTALKIVRDGRELPPAMIATGLRSARRNEVKITLSGQLILRALMRIDESLKPIGIDYYNLCEGQQGLVQLGIVKWEGDALSFNISPPGGPRPQDFAAPAGSGCTFSQWRPKV